jgi:RHS repeat-associated protein
MSFPEGTQQSYEYGLDPLWGTQSTFIKNSTSTTANGLTSTNEGTRTATLTDNSDPFSIETLTDTTSINGRAYTSAYNAAARTSTSTTPEGRKSFATVDARGRIEKAQVDGLHPINYSYDSRGRLSGITQGNSTDTRTTSFSYQSDGNLSTIVDPLGQAVDFEYDKAGRVTRQTLPDGRQINYTYDANGNVTTITPPGQQAHTFDYTPVDLNSIYTPPRVGRRSDKTKYSYNTDQQLTKIKRPDGQTVNLGYDSAGRLSTFSVKGKKRSSNEDTLVYYQYNITGNVETITTLDGDSLSFGYDGNMILDETWSGTVEGKVSRAYNNNFQVSSTSVNNGNTIDFKYDADSLLTQAGDLALSRDARNGLITGSTLGGVTDVLTYNGFGEPTEYNVSYNGTNLYHVQYTFDTLGRIIEKAETVDGETHTYGYTYDPLGQITEIQKDNEVITTYAYDSNGNRKTCTDSSGTKNGSYDGQDRLTRYGDTKYKYTANGELLSKSNGGKTTRYTYDIFGNLKAVTLPDGTNVTYLVDGSHRRIGKQVNGNTVQRILYNNRLRPIAELDGNNDVVSRFVYANLGTVPDYLIKNGVNYRIISDQLGSPRLIMNTATGEIVQRIDYDTFGNVTNDTNPGFQPFGFAGGLYDQDTKLVRFGTRDYDAETGRWTAKDLIGFAGGDSNLFRYVKNNPVSYIDADGKNPVGIIVVVGLVGYAAWEIYDWIKTYADEAKAAQERFDKKMKSGDVYEAAVELSGSTVNIAASCTQSAMELSGTSITGPVETDIPGFVADQIKGQLRETLKK